MRHAKSSWKSGAPSDHARPLNGRGKKAAPRVASELAARGWIPDHVISSDSARTRQTWERMRDGLGFEGAVRFTRDLYHAGITELLALSEQLDDTHGCLLLLGHNPGWEDAVAWLTAQPSEMKTGCAALLSIDAPSWEHAFGARGDWQLVHMIRPREL
ncbi:MAG: histidine phosphatase family protein [Sandaracinaceae bacterium]